MECLHDRLKLDTFGVFWICANKECDATIDYVTDQMTIYDYYGV